MKLTDDYILGLIDGEGCFTFHTSRDKVIGLHLVRSRIPAFTLAMHERDQDLVRAVRDHLGLRNKVYLNGPYQGDGARRGKQASLFVRDLGSLKNIIIPFFYNNLKGYKKVQFEKWLNDIGTDPRVEDRYKILHRLFVTGYWDTEKSSARNPR